MFHWCDYYLALRIKYCLQANGKNGTGSFVSVPKDYNLGGFGARGTCKGAGAAWVRECCHCKHCGSVCTVII